MKKKYVIVALLALTLASILIVFTLKEKKVETKEPKKVLEKEEKEEIKTSKLSLVMVGDALLHSSVYNDAYKNGVYDFSSQLEYIKPIIQKYDLAFYNQESILGGTSIGLSDYPTFNSPQEFGDAMVDAGFNLVSLANNHTLDRGEKAVLNSCEYWKTKDVLTAGSYTSFEEANEIKIKEKNGIKYTLLSYTYGTNGIPVPSGKEYLVNLYSDEKAKEDIEKVKDKVDIILVSMHWGTEYQFAPDDRQRELAQWLSDQGVDVIIGTHPHVLQPRQMITGEKGNETLVFYSLGNFVSAQDVNSRMLGAMAKWNMIYDPQDGHVAIEDVRVEPTVMFFDAAGKNVQVYPLSQYDDETASRHLLSLQGEDMSVSFFHDLCAQIMGEWMEDEE